MTRVRQILPTALLVLTAVSAGLLAGCDRRQSLSYSGSYWSGGSYPRLAYHRPTQLYSPARTVYIGSGSLYYPGRISHTRIRSYPRVYRPLVTRRGYRYGGRRRAPTSRRTHPYRRSGHSGGSHGTRGHR